MLKDNKYLSSYVPEVPKKIGKDSIKKSYDDENKIAQIEEALSAIQDDMAKSNRDNLDAMYNIDTDNLSPYFKKLLAKYSTDITQAQASIEAWANETKAGFEAVAQWKTEFESKEYVSQENLAASIGTYLNGEDGQATIVSAVSGQFVTKDTLTGYVQTNQLSAAITQAVDQYESKLHLSVANNDKSSTISLQALQNGSYVTISSGTITLAGNVVFKSDLSTAGATTINGANVTTDNLYLQKIYYQENGAYVPIVASNFIGSGSNATLKVSIGPQIDNGRAQFMQMLGTEFAFHSFSSDGNNPYALRINTVNREIYPDHAEDYPWNLGTESNPFYDVYATGVMAAEFFFKANNVTYAPVLWSDGANIYFTNGSGTTQKLN